MLPSNPLISIVVPAYNSEKYIGKCLSSIQRQSYSNIEIIVIDDGSVDGTLDIANHFASIDKRFFVFHQENSGQSAARNEGLKHISGDYYTYVDSDDEVLPNYVLDLLRLLKKYNADISISGFLFYSSNNSRPGYRCNNKVIYGTDNIIKSFLLGESMYGPVAKLYKTSLLGEIEFVEGRIFEDVEYLSRVYQCCNILAMGNQTNYVYYVRPSSTVHSDFDERKFDLIRMTQRVVNNIRDNNYKCEDELLRFKLNGFISFLLICLDSNMMNQYTNACRKITSWINQNKKRIILNTKIEIKLKIYSIIFLDRTGLLKSVLYTIRRVVK